MDRDPASTAPVAISILADSPLSGVEMGRWMIAEVHLDHDSEEAADARHRESLAPWWMEPGFGLNPLRLALGPLRS